jgi:corrinoid protein of di/trimethylamine methyltransferase
MNEVVLEELKNVVLTWDGDKAEPTARKAIDQGVDPVACAAVIADALKIIGDKYSTGEAFLPDLFVASKVANVALRLITEEIRKQGKSMKSLGKVVIGTVFGDIHSIGKDIVATLLFAEGFEVIDLGVNVKADTFLKAVNDHRPHILALSALLTTTAMEQRNVIEGLKRAGVRDKVKVLIGGGPINQEFADKVGADGYGATGPSGVTVARQLIGK